MGRPLKVFRVHLGFFDTIVAAPSQKAAIAAWGGAGNEFAKGFASVTNDPKAVKAALAHPGVVLRRPFGSNEPFAAKPVIPKVRASSKARQQITTRAKRAAEQAAQNHRDAADAAAKKELDQKLKSIDAQEQRLKAARDTARAEYRSRVRRQSRP